MSVPWQLRRPDLLVQVKQDVATFCSTLHVAVEHEHVWIRGTFPVMLDSRELDRFAVQILLPLDYPDGLPRVRETGGRIAWTADAHAYVNGNACVLLPEERWWIHPPGSSLLDYLRGPLHNYFLGQSVVAAGGSWPFGEHQHGPYGVLDFYRDKFDTKDLKLILTFLRLVADEKVRGHQLCPCGGGKILRECHPGVITVAKHMPPKAATESLVRLLASLQREVDRMKDC